MPSQAIALTMPSVHSGRLREASVSSMRSTNAPPCCLANAQLNSADLADPTWNMPVGDGANLTLTGGCSGGEVVTHRGYQRVHSIASRDVTLERRSHVPMFVS